MFHVLVLAGGFFELEIVWHHESSRFCGRDSAGGAGKKEIGFIIIVSDVHHVFLLPLNGLSGIQAGAK